MKRQSKIILNFFSKKGLGNLIFENKKNDLNINQLKSKSPYKPNLDDLFSLYNLVIKNKRTTILEFGSGWSTLIFAIALSELKNLYSKKVKNLRRNNPFELFVVDNENKFLNITKNRIKKYFDGKCPIKIHYLHSEVNMTMFNGRIATEYSNLPKCSPDFIYLDAPDQFNIKKSVNGFNLDHLDLVPMSCDILKFEHFLNPQTILIIDGRRSNAQFIKKNFQLNWKYKYLKNLDQHFFQMMEKANGEQIKRIVKFYK
jgi:hypothetical protein